ncbi:fibronectin type III domain-containing protein [Elusimicrobiota bacterium]
MTSVLLLLFTTQAMFAQPYGATDDDLSEFFMGDVAVGVIFLESDGTTDIDSETWKADGSEPSTTTVMAEIQNGLDWWAYHGGASSASLSFVYVSTVVNTQYEPIQRNSGSPDEVNWVNDVMGPGKLGYIDGTSKQRVRHYADDLRDTNNTDWAFVIFVINSWHDSDGTLADGMFAYAYLGGPYQVVTYDNNGYGINDMDMAIAHETGHIFYAFDEYASAGNSVTDRSGYLNIQNGNNENDGITDDACIMRGQVAPFTNGDICPYTRQMLGWRDSNGNEIFDILDTTPTITINAYNPDPTADDTPTFSGTAVVISSTNDNPWGGGRDMTINTISDVEYKIDSGSWISGNPVDGAFDEASEDFDFTVSPLANAQYTFWARAVNNRATSSTAPVSDVLTINDAAPTNNRATFVSSTVITWEYDLVNGADTPLMVISTVSNFSVWISSESGLQGQVTTTYVNLNPNTTYYFKVKDEDAVVYSVAAATATHVEPITNLYIDELSTASITVSAYAETFSNLDATGAGLNFAKNSSYEGWAAAPGVWTTRASMPMLRTRHASAVVGGKIYLVGGYNNVEVTKVTNEYDPVANSWATKAAMPTARERLTASVVGNKIYAIGAGNTSYLATNEEYDPEADAWVTRAPMPTARGFITSQAVGNKIYVVGGRNGAGLPTGYMLKNEEYDPATNSWTTKSVTGFQRRYSPTSSVVNGKIYVIGGWNGTYKDYNEVYDPANDTWTTKKDMPISRIYLSPNSPSIGGKIYVIGGYYIASLDNSEVYDPVQNSWTTRDDMPTARSSLATEAVEGKIYALGGSTWNENEEFDTGLSKQFTGLTPDQSYTFSAKARNHHGVETAEVSISSYTAANPPAAVAVPFSGVSANGMTVNWSINNNPGTEDYYVEVSTTEMFNGTGDVDSGWLASSASVEPAGLSPNTTYYARVKARNSNDIETVYLNIGSTCTLIETPGIYVDEISSTAITVSAYSSTFTNLTGLGTGFNFQKDSDGWTGWTTSTGSWTTKAVMPGGGRIYHAVAVVGGKIYAIGGYDSSENVKTNEEYDPATNSWAVRASMANGRTELEAAAVGNKIYAIGGKNSGTTYVSTNEEYDPEADSWSDRAPMPTGRGQLAAVVVNEKIYAIGGINAPSVLIATNEEYDPAMNSWTTKAPTPSEGRMSLAGAAVGGKIYVTGGLNDSVLKVDLTEEYDPATNSWETKASMSTKRYDHGVVAAGGRIYAIGGYNGGDCDLNEEYNPVSNSWEIRPSLADANNRVSGAVVGGKIYVIGGHNEGSGYMTATEEYFPGLSYRFSGLTPDQSYTFYVKARNQHGMETTVVSITSYTAVNPPVAAATPLSNVSTESVTVSWDKNNNPNTAAYSVDMSTSSAFDGTDDWSSSWVPDIASLQVSDIDGNTTFYFRVNARNSDDIETMYLYLGSTMTLMEPPISIYMDNLSTTSVVVSAFASDFTNAGLTGAGLNFAKDSVYEGWVSGADSWSARAPMPTSRYRLTSSAAGGKIYAIGGRDTAYIGINEEYDPATNSWTTRTSMLTDRGNMASSVVGNKIYVFGSAAADYDQNEVYDPEADTWETRAAIPTGRFAHCSAVVGNKIYVIGGHNVPNPVATNEEYDPALNSWATRASMAISRRYLGCAVIENKIYAMGGTNGSAYYQKNEEYDPTSNTWASKANIPVGRAYHTVAASGGKIYTIGGWNGAYVLETQAYSPFLDSWVTKSAISAGRKEITNSVVDGKIHVIGGTDAGAAYNSTHTVYDTGVTYSFTALTPNTQYAFKVKARNQHGTETSEVSITSYTAANIPASTATIFSDVYTTSATVTWTDNNNPGTVEYNLEISTLSSFNGSGDSSIGWEAGMVSTAAIGLSANTTYFFQAAARNSDDVETTYLNLGSTITLMETPTAVYIDELSTTSVTISAYASDFTNLAVSGGLAFSSGSTWTDWTATADQWSSKADLANGRYVHGSAVVGGKIYAIGGWNVGKSALNEEYDPVTDAWTTREPMLTSRNGLAVAAVRGKIYAIGGASSSRNECEEYDPITDTWVSRADMPSKRQFVASAVVENKIYVIGGWNSSSGYVDINEVYDPITNKWATKAALSSNRNGPTASVVNGKIYVIGGSENGTDVLSITEEYDPNTDTWTTKASMPTERYLSASAAIGGKIYAIGGKNNVAAVVLGENEVYDPVANTWGTRSPMAVPRQALTASAINGKIYVTGGENGTELKIVQEYDPGVSTTFTDLEINTQYVFRVKAKNQHGIETSEFSVSSYTAVNPPASVVSTFTEVAGSSITVWWDANNNPATAEYYLEASTVSTFDGASDASFGWTADITSAAATSLSPFTTYYFMVKARNSDGIETVYLNLGSARTAMGPPQNVGIDNVFRSSITVSWDAILGSPDKFILEASSTNFDGTDTPVSSETTNTDVTILTVYSPALLENTTYYLKAGALWGDATDYADVISTSTLALAPDGPFSVSAAYLSSVTVSWNEPEYSAQGYQIVASSTNFNGTGTTLSSVTLNGVQTSITVENLSSNTTYYFAGASYNWNMVLSSYSHMGSSVTRLEAPTAIYVDELSSTTVTISAYAPTFTNLASTGSGVNFGIGATPSWQGWEVNADTWTTKTSMQVEDRGRHASAEVGGKIYVIGGYNGSGYVATNEEYDPVTDSWDAKTSMQIENRGYLSAVAVGGKIYAIGGYNGSGYVTTNEEYDPESNSWAAKASIPTEGRGVFAAAAVDNKIYAIGGYNGTGYVTTNEEYDPGTSSWTVKSPIEIESRGRMGAVAVNGKIYVIGGYNGSGYVDTNQEYDPAADSWGARAPMQAGGRGRQAVATAGGKVYVVGGYDGNYIDKNEVYDPATNSWETKAPLVVARSYLSATAMGGKIYAIGGYDDSYLATNEEYNPGVSHRFTGLTIDTEYVFTVKARNQLGVETGSISITSFTAVNIPTTTVPTFSDVFATSMTVSWADNGNPGTAEYYVEFSTSQLHNATGDVAVGWITETSTEPKTLSANSTYYVRVKARNSAQVETAYLVLGSTFTAFSPAPVNVAIDNVHRSSITASWDSMTNPDPDKFILEASSTNFDGTDTAVSSETTNIDVISLSVFSPALNPNTTYYVRAGALWVNTTNYAGAISTSTIALAPDGPLSIIEVMSSSVTVSWNEPDYSAQGYRVEASSTDFDGTGAIISSVTLFGSQESATVSGLSDDTTYYFRVASYNWDLALSSYSAIGSTWTIAYPEVQNMAISDVYTSSITVTWDAPIMVPIKYILVASSTNFDGTEINVASQTTNTSVMSLTVYNPGLNPNTTYYFRVGALFDETTSYSGTELSTSTLATPPEAAFSLVNVFESSVTLSWSAPEFSAQAYQIAASSTNFNGTGTIFSSVTANGSQTSITVENLSANTTYYFVAGSYNWNMVLSTYTVMGSSITNIEIPVMVYIDELSTTTVTISAYAPMFTNLSSTGSGVHFSEGANDKGWTVTADSWSVKAPIQTENRGYLSAAAVAGRIYAIGGYNGTGYVKTNEEYDPVANSWSTKAPMQAENRGIMAVAVVGEKIYAIGGYNGTGYLKTNEEYDPVANSWSAKAPIPTEDRGAPAAAAIAGKIYVIGGWNASTYFDTNEEYDPATNSWSIKAPMQAENRGALAAAVVGEKIYAIGGRNEVAYIKTNEEYDPVANSWSTKAPMPTENRGVFAAAAVAGKIYAIGGYNDIGYVKTNEEYDPATNSWSFKALMQTEERGALAAVAVAGKIYAIGGRNNSGYVSTNEEYDPGVSYQFSDLSINTQYTFTVKARNQHGAETAEVSITSYTAANVPASTETIFSNVYATSATVTWTDNNNPGTVEYYAQASSASVFNGTNDASVGWTAGMVTNEFTSLIPNVTHYFMVKARNSDGVETAYNVLGSTLTDTMPLENLAITNVFITSVTATWDAMGTSPDKFILEASSTDFNGTDTAYSSSTTDGSAVTLTAPSLTPDTTYYLRAGALWGDTTDYTASISTITQQLAPQGLSVSQVYVASITASWSSLTPAPDKFILDASSTNYDGTDVPVSSETVNASVISLSAFSPALNPNTTYYLRVGAFWNNTTNYASAVSTVTLASSVNESFSFSGVHYTSVTIAWDALADGATGYTLEACASSNFSSTIYSSTTYDITLSTLTVIDLAQGTPYYFRVGSLNTNDVANYMFAGSTTTNAMGFELNPDIGAVYVTSMTITWDLLGAASYNAVLASDPSYSTIISSGLLSTNTTTYVGLSGGSTYYFEVKLSTEASTSYIPNRISTVTYLETPTGFASSVLGVSSITWGWTDITGEHLWRVASSTGGNVSGNLPSGTTYWTEINLSTNTAYARASSAYNPQGYSTSSFVTAYTLAASPTWFALTDVYITSVAVQWGANTNPAGTNYRIDRWALTGSTISVTVDVTTATLTRLVGGTTYYYKVWAINGDSVLNSTGVEISTVTNGLIQAQESVAPGESKTITYVAPAGDVTVSVAPNTFAESVQMTVEVPATIPAAVSPTANMSATGVAIEVSIDKSIKPKQFVYITITYEDSDVVGLNENQLIVARYDISKGVWVPLKSTVDALNNRVTGQTNHFSTFQIMQASPSGTVATIKAFPNPFRPFLGHQNMTFSQVPANAKIKVYTIAGELVRELTSNASGIASWDSKNENGLKCASGVYFVFAEGQGGNKTIKVAIQR